jgi:hypothetical protein
VTLQPKGQFKSKTSNLDPKTYQNEENKKVNDWQDFIFDALRQRL